MAGGSRWPERAGLLALALLLSPAAWADEAIATDSRFPMAPMHEEVLRLSGDPARPATLEVTLYTPPGAGPFPLAIVNHGATNWSQGHPGERDRFNGLAYYFLSRGYAVALPMMRGFAGSDGTLPLAGCDLAAMAVANGRDIRAVAEALGRRPAIDAARTVVAGVSFGGLNTLGFGTAPSQGARALVGFYPALRSSGCPAQDRGMVDAAARLGGTPLPSLWFYGDNDSVVPVATWRAMFDRYRTAKNRAELVAFGSYGSDSHFLLSHSDSLPLWAPRLDTFLARAGLPSATAFPQYLPLPAPPPSHFADVDDVDAVPWIDDRGRANYRRFLEMPRPRVFVIAANGSLASRSGGWDPLGRVMEECSRITRGCQAYAVDGDVVWSGPRWQAGLAAPAIVTRVVRMDTTVSMTLATSVRADCTPNELPKLAVVDPPSHGTARTEVHDQTLAAGAGGTMAGCVGQAAQVLTLSYTPSPGYTGADSMVLEETAPGPRRRLVRMELRVM